MRNTPWHKLVGWSLGAILWVHHEQHVGEPGPKISSVCVVVSGGFRGVNIHALWTVELHHRFSGDVWQTYVSRDVSDGQYGFKGCNKRQSCGFCLRKCGFWKGRLTNRKHRLILTIHPGAIAKIPLLILFQLWETTNLEIAFAGCHRAGKNFTL